MLSWKLFEFKLLSAKDSFVNVKLTTPLSKFVSVNRVEVEIFTDGVPSLIASIDNVFVCKLLLPVNSVCETVMEKL